MITGSLTKIFSLSPLPGTTSEKTEEISGNRACYDMYIIIEESLSSY